jgi:hypothetical protein
MAWTSKVTYTVNSKYAWSDMNRQNSNVEYVLGQLTELGYVIDNMSSIKTDYTRLDFPTPTGINNIKNNVLLFIAATAPTGQPAIIVSNARIQNFDYIQANALELNLQVLHDILQNLENGILVCGAANAICGQTSSYL